jgi:prepilin-type N-terminal cleavage/methylation domain-containing protein
MNSNKGITLIEVMVVTFIVGIMAAVAIPIMRGRIDTAKWSEANLTAGTIRSAVRTFIAENGPDYDYKKLKGKLDKPSLYTELGFNNSDLSGSYFNQRDYQLKKVQADPIGCIVEVKSSHPEGPPGRGTLTEDGSWFVN